MDSPDTGNSNCRYLDDILPRTLDNQTHEELVKMRHKVSSNLRLSGPPTAPNVDQDVLQYLGLHQFVHQSLPSSIIQDRERIVDFISFHESVKRDEYVTYVFKRRIRINEAFRKALNLPSQIPLEAPRIDPCTLKTTALELMRVYIKPNYDGCKLLPRVQKAMEDINNGLAHKIDWSMLIFKEAMREINAMTRMSTKVKWNCFYSGYWHMVLVSENFIQMMPADAAAPNVQLIGDNIVGNQTKAPTPQGDDSGSIMGSETPVGFGSPVLESNVNEFDEQLGQSYVFDNEISSNQTKDPSTQEVDGSGSITDAALEVSQSLLRKIPPTPVRDGEGEAPHSWDLVPTPRGHLAEGTYNFTSLEAAQEEELPGQPQDAEDEPHGVDDNVVHEVNEVGDGTERNEEVLQGTADTLSRDEESEALAIERSGQRRPAAAPPRKKQEKELKRPRNNENIDHAREMEEREREAREKDAAQAFDFSIRSCILVLNTMEVTKEEKAKAYEIFIKGKENRETFICACEVDQEAALIWLRSKMA
ncbi:unnamed protein product [Urochloa humidicola]